MLNVKQDISKKNNILVYISILFIQKVYRKKIKPILKKKRNLLCSFYPDCSSYGILALKKYGFFLGWAKTINRIAHCKSYQHEKSCIDYP